MNYYGVSDKGKVRKENQDCFAVRECLQKKCIVFALCDGMGGTKAGGIASEIAKRAFTEYVIAKLTSRVNRSSSVHDVIRNACTEANGVVYAYSQFDEKYSDMGTTIVGGVITKDGNAYIANVGDSRAYHLSARSGRITQVTTDHSLVEELVHAGMITKEQAAVHPKRHVITRALGTEGTVKSDTFEIKLAKGDMLLVCSDGLTNCVSEEEIFAAYKADSDPCRICDTLLDLTFKHGAPDNVTVVAMVK